MFADSIARTTVTPGLSKPSFRASVDAHWKSCCDDNIMAIRISNVLLHNSRVMLGPLSRLLFL
jgi:hypothetical protein